MSQMIALAWSLLQFCNNLLAGSQGCLLCHLSDGRMACASPVAEFDSSSHCPL